MHENAVIIKQKPHLRRIDMPLGSMRPLDQPQSHEREAEVPPFLSQIHLQWTLSLSGSLASCEGRDTLKGT